MRWFLHALSEWHIPWVSPKVRQPVNLVVRLLATGLGGVLLLVAWEALVRWQDYPPYILPSPSLVWHKFVVAVADGTLWRHTRITLIEILAGLALGTLAATLLGYALAKCPWLESLVGPYLVAAQAIPVVAIAPLIIIWAGTGVVAKILVTALTLFFPVLVNTMVGIRSVEPDLMDLMRSLNASRWQIFRLLEVPAALPILLGGLKIGTALAVIGAVVGEFVAADQGLGFLINLTARGTLDTALLFVTLGTLMVIAVGLYLLVSAIERRVLRWREG